MLVDESYYRTKAGPDEWDVVFYLVPHWSDLASVRDVSYAIETDWGNATFVANDLERYCTVKAGSYGSVRCTANIVFKGGTSAQLARYALVS